MSTFMLKFHFRKMAKNCDLLHRDKNFFEIFENFPLFVEFQKFFQMRIK